MSSSLERNQIKQQLSVLHQTDEHAIALKASSKHGECKSEMEGRKHMENTQERRRSETSDVKPDDELRKIVRRCAAKACVYNIGQNQSITMVLQTQSPRTKTNTAVEKERNGLSAAPPLGETQMPEFFHSEQRLGMCTHLDRFI